MSHKIIRFSEINPQKLREVFSSLSLDYLESKSLIKNLKQEVKDFLPAYPNISIWYKKVIEEIDNNPEEREMFISLYDKDSKLSISGIMILKNKIDEKKICALRIKDEHQRLGIGTEFLIIAFEYLKTKKPLITVPEEYIGVFSRIFEKHNFQQTEKIKGLYRKDKFEYIYNEKFK